jgi:succinylglutamic semialdehyde dehydrogenase
MSASELLSFDPCTGELVWQGPIGGTDAAVRAARGALRGWSQATFTERVRVAETFREVVLQNGPELATIISRETGKPHWEAKTEVASVAAKIEISVEAYVTRTGDREAQAQGIRQAVRHKPHGVLAVLGPYNFPAHLPNGHIVPALLAGNAIVFKPSEFTPATAELLAGFWREAGLPDGVLQVVQGNGATGRDLASHPGIDGLLFTGSAATGAALARQYAETPHKVLALEMGGNNPLIVWDADDLDAAASIVIQSAFLSAGQRCSCARRLIVSQAQADALIDRLVDVTRQIRIGAPFDDPEPFMGPVIDNAAADRLLAAARGLSARSAKTIAPLERLFEDKPFLSPAIIDVTGAEVADEEYFGPLLQVQRVTDFEAAIAVANHTRFGLAASLVGGDEALYRRFWQDSRAGVVNWNRPTNGAASSAPFGGIGASGNHRPSAFYAADYVAWPVASLEASRLVPIEMKGLNRP